MPGPDNPPQQARAIETRRRLLEAAVDCLVASGYAATTTSDVCAAAGVSQGAPRRRPIFDKRWECSAQIRFGRPRRRPPELRYPNLPWK